MKIRPRTCGEWAVAALFVAVLLLIAAALMTETCWVGSTDLEIEFVVTDATSGEPVPGAIVEVQSGGELYAEREARNFRLSAGPDGRATSVCRDSMCFGRSGLFTNTYAVHLPFWSFRGSAPGFEPSEWVDLDVSEYRRHVQRLGPRRAKLVVPMSLNKIRN